MCNLEYLTVLIFLSINVCLLPCLYTKMRIAIGQLKNILILSYLFCYLPRKADLKID